MTQNKPFYKSNEFKVSFTILILGGLGTLGYDLYKEEKLLTTLKSLFSLIWSFIIHILTYKISLFWIILAILFFFTIAYIKRVFKSSDNKKKRLPEYLNYRSGRLKKWKWTWGYTLENGQYVIDKLEPRCLSCDTLLHYNSRLSEAHCPRCEQFYYGNSFERKMDIETLIIDNIEKQTYNKW